MSKEWYVLRVQAGREETVRESLLKKIQLAGLEELVPTVLVPTERVSEMNMLAAMQALDEFPDTAGITDRIRIHPPEVIA